MKEMLRRFITLSALLIVCAPASALASSAASAGDAPPAWLRQAAATAAPAYDKKVPAVVLHDGGR